MNQPAHRSSLRKPLPDVMLAAMQARLTALEARLMELERRQRDGGGRT